ncbi:hypothetical protein XalbCFBP2523_14345 [Xanthomonas albilineans]|nr:hypothetical protein XalbCFBP2523_14345 [Xanthomonas albilineans]
MTPGKYGRCRVAAPCVNDPLRARNRLDLPIKNLADAHDASVWWDNFFGGRNDQPRFLPTAGQPKMR